jgi:hypothetical protein
MASYPELVSNKRGIIEKAYAETREPENGIWNSGFGQEI